MKDFLLSHAASDPVSFHMPGHKGMEIFRKYGYGDFLERFVDCDVTEIPGADNLFQAEGIIKEAQDRYADIYDVDRSYLLINGTSGGIIAAILAAVRTGEKLIMARNCHKSVFNAASLGKIEPVYARPEIIEQYGIMGPVSPHEIERLIVENPDSAAVILPSPNYYGICSDIEGIAHVVHKAGKVLIVDQAHGAHLKFFHKYGQGRGMPLCAEDQGADIVINSIHKTLASLTQSAVLNLKGNRVDRYVLEDKLQMIESTSPSYILMSFLDMNRELLERHGDRAMKEWKEALGYFYEKAAAIPGLKVLDIRENMDRTKINLDMSAKGIDGARLEKELMARGIFPELYTGDLLMLMTGIGNTKAHMERTLKALEEISAENPYEDDRKKGMGEVKIPFPGGSHKVPEEKEFVHISEAAGRVCAGSVIPYPPGIPLVCPGEELTEEVLSYVKKLREDGEKVIGINDEDKVLVGK